jgi:membrane protease YdiL (CAAX protease family)
MTLADLGITFSKQEIILTILFILLSLLPMFCGSIDRVSNNSLLFNIGYFLIVGVAEEVFYRGYIKCKLKTCPVLIWRFVSAVLFAALHTISSEKLTPIIVIYLLSAGFIFAVVRDCITSLISIILFHSTWDIGSSYSDNYSNIIWIILIWLLFIIIAKVHYIIINKLRYQKMR